MEDLSLVGMEWAMDDIVTAGVPILLTLEDRPIVLVLGCAGVVKLYFPVTLVDTVMQITVVTGRMLTVDTTLVYSPLTGELDLTKGGSMYEDVFLDGRAAEVVKCLALDVMS